MHTHKTCSLTHTHTCTRISNIQNTLIHILTCRYMFVIYTTHIQCTQYAHSHTHLHTIYIHPYTQVIYVHPYTHFYSQTFTHTQYTFSHTNSQYVHTHPSIHSHNMYIFTCSVTPHMHNAHSFSHIFTHSYPHAYTLIHSHT